MSECCTWNNIVLQKFKELLSDVVLTHAVLQSQVELVAAVQHLVTGFLLGPKKPIRQIKLPTKKIRGITSLFTFHISECHRHHKHQQEYVWTTTLTRSPYMVIIKNCSINDK